MIAQSLSAIPRESNAGDGLVDDWRRLPPDHVTEGLAFDDFDVVAHGAEVIRKLRPNRGTQWIARTVNVTQPLFNQVRKQRNPGSRWVNPCSRII